MSGIYGWNADFMAWYGDYLQTMDGWMDGALVLVGIWEICRGCTIQFHCIPQCPLYHNEPPEYLMSISFTRKASLGLSSYLGQVHDMMTTKCLC